MDTKKQSFLKRLNIRFLKLGTKINILVISLILLCIFVISLFTFRNFDKSIYNINRNNLEELAILKKNSLEKEFNQIVSQIPDIVTYDLENYTNSLIGNFNDYSSERSGAFIDDSVKYYSKILRNYYTNEIIGNINWETPKTGNIFPTDTRAIIFQTDYLVENPNSYGEKEKMDKSGNITGYSATHEQIQLYLKEYANKYYINNFYLIDSKLGNIIYCYDKNIAFCLNIYSSYLKQTGLAATYQRSLMAKSEQQIVMSDFENFLPALNQPVSFIGIPVFYNSEKIAVLILELSPAFYESILNINLNADNNNPVAYYLVGSDYFLRTAEIDQIDNPDDYFNAIKKQARHNNELEKAYLLKNTALAVKLDKAFVLNGFNSYKTKNFLGDNVLIQTAPVKLNDFNWCLIAQLKVRDALSSMQQMQVTLLGVFLVLFIIAVILTRLFVKSIVTRLNSIKLSMQGLAKGEQSDEALETRWHDELGNTTIVYNTLNKRIQNAVKFALQLSAGNYPENFEAGSDNDNLAMALNTLKERLQTNNLEAAKREQEDKIRNWTNEGVAKFNDLMRQSNNNIQNLSYLLLENLISYLGANVGGVFLVEGENANDIKINLIASYAFDRKKFHTKSIEAGEGLIGNCYLEKKPIYLKKIPEDYLEIVTGFGSTMPKALYIVPLMMEQQVLGLIEIASLEVFEDYKIDFINKLAENIASTFATVKLNSKTAELLEESKRRAHEIAQQEEEMRQNLEEMQATQEELARMRSEDEQRTQDLKYQIEYSNTLLNQLINSMEGEVYLKDENGVIILSNEIFAIRFGTTPDKMNGKTDYDIFTAERIEKEQQLEEQVKSEGVMISGEILEQVGDKEQKYFVVKKQLYIPGQKTNGILTIRIKR